MTREAFQSQLEALNQELLAMGELVQRAISTSVGALVTRDRETARQVIDGDQAINAVYHQVEGLCLDLLLRQQPMAKDLRRITTILKVITDLERIADHAVDIAKVAERLAGQKLVKPLVDIPQMALLAQEMVGSALSAFVAKDRERANNLAALDHDLDRLYRLTITEIEELMQQDPAAVSQGIQLLFTSQALERIGDHATNLGEWFIFLETGERTDLNQ